MPRIPIFRLGRSAEEPLPPQLGSYTPKLTLEGLQLGVDNLRHDVHLSPRFVEQARLQIARLIMRHGDMEGLLAAEKTERLGGNHFIGSTPARKRNLRKPAGPNSSLCLPTCMLRRSIAPRPPKIFPLMCWRGPPSSNFCASS